MRQFIIIITLSGILSGCTKASEESKYYTINGLVLDLDSQLPIAAAKVKSISTCSPGCPPTDSALTDGAGKVSFRFRIDDIYETLIATKGNYLNQSGYYLLFVYRAGLGEVGDSCSVRPGKPKYNL